MRGMAGLGQAIAFEEHRAHECLSPVNLLAAINGVDPEYVV
jgi:hypothetical protein